MPYASLPLALAIGLMLGAAPPHASSAAECRLSHRHALAELGRLPVRNRVEQESEHAFGYTLTFDPTGLTAFGFPVRALSAADINAIRQQSLTLAARLDAPYPAVRAAALRSRGKSGCANREGPPHYCEIDERRFAGWTIS